MTPIQVREIIKEYRKRILAIKDSRMTWVRPLESCRVDPNMVITDHGWKTYSHVLWMCDQIEIFLNKDEWDKANRWLGFIQGTLWMSGIFTIDDMRGHNR